MQVVSELRLVGAAHRRVADLSAGKDALNWSTHKFCEILLLLLAGSSIVHIIIIIIIIRLVKRLRRSCQVTLRFVSAKQQ